MILTLNAITTDGARAVLVNSDRVAAYLDVLTGDAQADLCVADHLRAKVRTKLLLVGGGSLFVSEDSEFFLKTLKVLEQYEQIGRLVGAL